MPCPKGKKASKKCRERNGERDNDESQTKSKDSPKSTTATPASSTTSGSAAPPKSTPASLTSSTMSSSATPIPTADCAAIGRRDTEVLQEEYPDLEDGPEEERDNSGNQDRSIHLEARAGSYKPKRGKACGIDFWSGKYPPSGDEFMVSLIFLSASSVLIVDVRQKGKLAFGYSVVDDCSSYDWVAQAGSNSIVGDTEHVLEWSMVSSSPIVFNSLSLRVLKLSV